jgi:hypothetical protein
MLNKQSSTAYKGLSSSLSFNNWIKTVNFKKRQQFAKRNNEGSQANTSFFIY